MNIPNKVLDRTEVMVPPSSIETEQQVLGSIILDPRVLDDLSLDANEFYNPANQRIYKHLRAMRAADVPIDGALLLDRLRQSSELDAIGGKAYLAEVVHSVPYAANAVYYAGIVRRTFRLRTLIDTATEMLRQAWTADADPDQVLDAAEGMLSKIVINQSDKELVTAEEATIRAQEKIDGIYQRQRRAGVLTGMESFDRIYGGLFPGEMIIIAARLGVGKTSLACQWADSIAARAHLTYFASLEMNATELATRILCTLGQVNGVKIRNASLNESDIVLLSAAARQFAVRKLRIDERPRLKVSDIRRATRRLVRRGLELIVVDYAQKIIPDDRRENREQQVAQIARDLKTLARELEVPVVVLAQLNRNKSAIDGTGGAEDLRECLSVASTMLLTPMGVQGNMPVPIYVHTLDKEGKIMEAKSINVPKTSGKMIRLLLRSGRFVECTPNHPIYTDVGWVPAGQITPHHAVGCVRVIPEPKKAIAIPESRWIGWMLGNGSMRGYSSPSFICSDEQLAIDFCQCTKKHFGLTPKRKMTSCAAVWEYPITWGFHTPKTNACKQWLVDHDLWGRIDKQKRIPDWFLQSANNESIAELLGGLYDTDGSVPVSDTRSLVVRFSTTSKELGWQITWCLTRLGIFARIDSGYMSSKATVPIFTIKVDEGLEIEKFRSVIRLTGKKGIKLTNAQVSHHGSNLGDRLGEWVSLRLRQLAIQQGLSHSDLGYRAKGRRISQRRLREVLDRIGKSAAELRHLINPHIFWDRSKSVRPIKAGPVFDRTVVGSNNFVANGIIVHNSDVLGQEADMVIRIDFKPPKKNEAAEYWLRVVKNRNGPTGRTPVDFDADLTLFTERMTSTMTNFDSDLGEFDGRDRNNF